VVFGPCVESNGWFAGIFAAFQGAVGAWLRSGRGRWMSAAEPERLRQHTF
jgi:hypothetical protein